MSHMVIYRGADGKPGYQQFDDIHDAVTHVEQLRNSEEVEHARIYRLEEVNFEYKPYYRVELTTGTTEIGAGAAAETVTESASDDDVIEAEIAEDASDAVDDSVDDAVDAADDLSDAADDAADDMDDDMADAGDPEAEASENGSEDMVKPAATARRGLFGR